MESSEIMNNSKSRHAIIVIKNKENKYLQYYDERWDSYLFLNCKLYDDSNNEIIKEYVSKQLSIDINKITSIYVGEKVHTKFSESAQKEKEYQHYFYDVKIEGIDSLLLDNTKYRWYSYDELLNDDRIKKVNSDIVGFIKEFNL